MTNDFALAGSIERPRSHDPGGGGGHLILNWYGVCRYYDFAAHEKNRI